MDANIELVKGDTLSFGMEFEDFTQPLSSAYFSVKKNLTDDKYIIQKSIGNGISRRSDNQYVIRLAPEDTENVTAGQYYYDLQISANSDVFTVLRGVMNILYPVTEDGSEPEEVIDVEAIILSLKSIYEKMGGTDDVSSITTIQDMLDKIASVIAG